MRLVDADAFIEFIRNLPKTENGYSRAYDESDIIHYINEQPTAYDVEKGFRKDRPSKNRKNWISDGTYRCLQGSGDCQKRRCGVDGRVN